MSKRCASRDRLIGGTGWGRRARDLGVRFRDGTLSTFREALDLRLNRGVAQTITQIVIGTRFVSHSNLQVVLVLCLRREKATNQQGAT